MRENLYKNQSQTHFTDSVVQTWMSIAGIDLILAILSMKSSSTVTTIVATACSFTTSSIPTRLSHTRITFGGYWCRDNSSASGIHSRGKYVELEDPLQTWSCNNLLELMGASRKEQLVGNICRSYTSSYSSLHEFRLDPAREPFHPTVAVQRIAAHGTGIQGLFDNQLSENVRQIWHFCTEGMRKLID